MIRDYDCDVVGSCEITEVRTQPSNLRTPFGERVGRLAAFLEFCAIIGSNAVDDDDADIEAFDCHRDLILQNVLLGFKIVNVSTLNPS